MSPVSICNRRTGWRTLITFLGILWSSNPAWACSVCFGDPDSPLAHGAWWGVVLLGLVTYGVLFGFASVAMTWAWRARKLEANSSSNFGQGNF